MWVCWGLVSIVTPDYISYCQRADRRARLQFGGGEIKHFQDTRREVKYE